MASHLHHTVKHIKEVRSEIPLWVCDWIMWQINRYPQDRPESSREALSVFLKNDRIPNQPMSTGIPQPIIAPPRARLIVPGAGPASKSTEAPPPATPTQGPAKANLAQTSQVATLAKESAASTQTAPQPLAPPEGFKPSVHSSSEDSEPQHSPVHTTAKGTHPSASKRLNQPSPPEKKPKKLSKSAKIGIITVISIFALVLGGFIFKLVQQKSAANKTAELIALAEKDDTKEIPISGSTLNILLKAAAASDSSNELLKMAKLLTLATATDVTDIDSRIADFVIQNPGLPTATKELLVGNVLRNRANPSILPKMLEFSSSTEDPKLIAAALQSIRKISGDEQFGRFLKLLETSEDNQVRDAAEANMVEVIKKSKNIEALANMLKSSQESTSKGDVQKAIKRLLGFCNTIKPATH
ncbi:MAG: hypothetical protein H8M99_14370 [Gloeobacteraceae cyanobacterium ES-bin-144]|nr:hypothetical protein [Verrucomicrobiales bacterium]